MRRIRITLILISLLLSILACNGGADKSSTVDINKKTSATAKKRVKRVQLTSPFAGSSFKVNSDIVLQYRFIKKEYAIDSLLITSSMNKVVLKEPKEVIKWNPNRNTTGVEHLRLTFYFKDGKSQIVTSSFLLLSDIVPKNIKFKIEKTYPHSITNYCQGLEFRDGFMYEGTGQNGESQLIKYALGSNKVDKSYKLDDQYFGEGITVLNDKIFQVTWRNSVGFVYNKADFTLDRKFSYNSEGWGLTNDGENIIMSDGSHRLYFLDSTFSTEIKRIEVCNDSGAVMSLNELEYIDGYVYANVYTKDYIVKIDPKTGKVVAKINCAGLLYPQDRHDDIDVLNGIAYNSKTGNLYITGKNWPKLFEISLID